MIKYFIRFREAARGEIVCVPITSIIDLTDSGLISMTVWDHNLKEAVRYDVFAGDSARVKSALEMLVADCVSRAFTFVPPAPDYSRGGKPKAEEVA